MVLSISSSSSSSMKSVSVIVRGILLCLLLTFVKCQVEVDPAIVIQNAERVIDISSQLVQITHKLKIENTGSSPAKYVLFTLEPHLKPHLSFIGATVGKEQKPLKTSVVTLKGDQKDAVAYRLDLPDALVKGKPVDVEVETVLTKYLQPFPTEITQKEKQFVKYVGNHYLYSPYTVTKQTTKVTLASKGIESFTKLKPFSQSDNILTFGPYENIPPFSVSELVIHYENNSPFLTVTKLERTIEVSHWGNIAVEEKIEIVHTGAKMKVFLNTLRKV